MLKTNSEKAAENIRAYIMNGFTPEGYTDNPPQSLNNSQKWSFNNRAARRGGSIFRRLTQCQSNG